MTNDEFCTWLDTFIEEKGIDLEIDFEVQGKEWGLNIIPVGVVIEHMKIANPTEQAQIYDTIVKIDFFNGNVPGIAGRLQLPRSANSPDVRRRRPGNVPAAPNAGR